jgi:hypothetical protein
LVALHCGEKGGGYFDGYCHVVVVEICFSFLNLKMADLKHCGGVSINY